MFYVLNGKKLILNLLCCLIAALGCVIIIKLETGLSEISVMMSESEKDVTEKAGKILVIDPGHGGEDGGAVAPDGTTESSLNWQIANRLKDLASYLGVPAVMTRENEAITYPESVGSISARKIWETHTRTDYVNSIPNSFLLSIHQNNYPAASPRGAQVLYAQGEDSLAWGCLTHDNMVNELWPENRRVAAPAGKSIYLMNHVNCPAILVECGFLSNSEERRLLQTESYQKKIAVVLMASFLQYENTRPEV